MTTITPFLWFDRGLEQAFSFYSTLFPGSRMVEEVRTPDGELYYGTLEILGQRVIGLNAGPKFPQTEAFSFFVLVQTQEEIDRLWNAFTERGQESQGGWLKDEWGVSWQIIPEALMRYQADPDREKADRVVQAMLGVGKIVIADLDAAAAAG